MVLNTNSVWQFKEVDGFAIGAWRQITVCPVTKLVILILIKEDRTICWPKPLCQRYFNDLVEAGAINSMQYALPAYLLQNEAEISNKARKHRDERLTLISSAIADANLPIKMALHGRVSELVEYARISGTTRLNLSNVLCLNWKFGQHPNALLPAYCHRGAPGTIREPGSKKRGRQRLYLTEAFPSATGVNIDRVTREAFTKAMLKKFLRENPSSIAKGNCYDNAVAESFFKTHIN